MSGKFLFDTNVVIDFLAGRAGLEDLGLRLAQAERYASVITRMELLSFGGLSAEEEFRVRRFLADLTIVPLDDETERAAIALRRATRLKLPDAIVAATAWVKGATLLTSDGRLLELNWPGLEIFPPV